MVRKHRSHVLPRLVVMLLSWLAVYATDGAGAETTANDKGNPAAAKGSPNPRSPDASQPRESWIDRPTDQWPQIAMINNIDYEDKTFPVAGCGFLLDTGTNVYAVTAKHVLVYFKSDRMDSVSFANTLRRWVMYPKNKPDDAVIVDRLINENVDESLEQLPSPKKDWLVFSIKERSNHIQPLKFRRDELRPGEKVFIIGWRYTDKNCTQRVYEGEVVRLLDGSFLVSTVTLADNTMPGLSGAPVIDSRGHLVGIMCRKHEKMEQPSSTKYPKTILLEH